MKRLANRWTLAAAISVAAACSNGAPVFPPAIAFDGETLDKGTSWTRGQFSGIVYVPPGQTMPTASPQIGVIVSGAHVTADALHEWIHEQAARAQVSTFYQSGVTGESCIVGKYGDRLYMALQVCEAGVARAACVEADEILGEGLFGTCLNQSDACFQDVCDQRWLARREALDLLLADFVTKR